ncbi:M24 family metallopeptidase [Sinorhizobium medicae]|nr:M24 family metallopeptidase [Sinorhizobium medicae]MDX1237644.1 M24 family metallopeptidase [Sinorhizobium medicae]
MPIEKGNQAFPREEYLRRLQAVKGKMAERGVERLIVTQPSNITYLSGYTALSAYVPQALVVSAEIEEPVFILRRSDAPAALYQCFFSRSNTIGYPETLVGSPDHDGYDFVIDHLLEAGGENSSVGLEVNHLSAQDVQKFHRRLSSASIVDCSDLVTWTRLIKSDLEITYMREAATIADAAMARAIEFIRPGVREADAAAEILAALARGVNGKAGTMVPTINMCTSPLTGTPHIAWSDGEFQHGSQVNLELGGTRFGYTAALMRTMIIGEPSDRLKRMHEAEVAGLEAALAAARPGNTCHDVANAFYTELKKFRFEKDSRCGYPIGIDWLEPSASLQLGDQTLLERNMTFHLMLGNWVDEDFGYVISESFRVTGSTAEVLTTTPRSLFQI